MPIRLRRVNTSRPSKEAAASENQYFTAPNGRSEPQRNSHSGSIHLVSTMRSASLADGMSQLLEGAARHGRLSYGCHED